ncbi:MAG: hypothetical protein KDC38_02635 [Planctomycetes bacterium]|nr:hypothetical protein [Planctomycetota bacterium]
MRKFAMLLWICGIIGATATIHAGQLRLTDGQEISGRLSLVLPENVLVSSSDGKPLRLDRSAVVAFADGKCTAKRRDGEDQVRFDRTRIRGQLLCLDAARGVVLFLKRNEPRIAVIPREQLFRSVTLGSSEAPVMSDAIVEEVEKQVRRFVQRERWDEASRLTECLELFLVASRDPSTDRRKRARWLAEDVAAGAFELTVAESVSRRDRSGGTFDQITYSFRSRIDHFLIDVEVWAQTRSGEVLHGRVQCTPKDHGCRQHIDAFYTSATDGDADPIVRVRVVLKRQGAVIAERVSDESTGTAWWEASADDAISPYPTRTSPRHCTRSLRKLGVDR